MAINAWMMDNNKDWGDEVTIEDLAEYFDGEVPECPSGGDYILTTERGERCTCTIHSEEEEYEYEE